MLQTYLEACGPGDRGQGSGEIGEDRLLLMNPWWRLGSYPELTRCLVAMRGEEAQLYWHLAERYFRVTRRQVQGRCPVCHVATVNVHTHVVRGLRQRFRPTDVIEERWHPRVDRSLVEISAANPEPPAIDWLVTRHRGPPYLPQELYDLVAA